MEVDFVCVDCGKSNSVELQDNNSTILCASCKKEYRKDFLDQSNAVQHCVVCGCRDLYIQKDFNRKLGLGIVVIGAILAPFTKLISLLVCVLIDFALYRMLPFITVCYRCKAIYRGFAANSAHDGFNLGINDRYRSAER